MKKLISKMDIPLLVLMILYSVLGIVMVLSSSSVSAVLRYHFSPYHFFIRQFIFVVGAFLIGQVILRIPTSKYKYFASFLLLGILASLVGLFFYGWIAGGAQSWYRLGFFNLQPSEFAKSVLIVYMAVFYNKLLKKPLNNFISLLIPIAIAFVIFILVAMQPDFGGAVIIGGIAFGVFCALPMKGDSKGKVLKTLGIAFIIGVVAILYSGKDLFNASQLSRLQFQNPCSRYMEQTGYQVCNGFIAIHNGGLFGMGLGNSTQKYLYLPEAHTDFIFPIIVEELGLIAGILILLGYVIMLYRILKIAKESISVRGSILAYGTFLLFALHLGINLMGVMALIPLTGVPLPLLSYGGSFTVNALIMLFIAQRVAIENNTVKMQRKIAKM